jgi:hypothetical protein
MSIFDHISNDFRILDGGLARTEAIDLVSSSISQHVIMKHEAEDVPQFYLFDREDFLKQLRRSAASTVGRMAEIMEATPISAIPLRADLSSVGSSSLVLDSGKPVGIIKPKSKVATLVKGKSAKVGTKSVLRRLSGHLPSKISVGMTTSLFVTLSADTSKGGSGADFSLPPGSKIDVLIHPREGLRLAGPGEFSFEISEPQTDMSYGVSLLAEQVGNGRVSVNAICSGVPIATFEITTDIVKETVTSATKSSPQAVRLEIEPRTRPDLSMFIFERDREITFHLQSADGTYEMVRYGPIKLDEPKEYFINFFRDVENLDAGMPKSAEEKRRQLELKCVELSEKVLPDKLMSALWELQDRIKTLQITSDEPWIPWEACRLVRRVDGEPVVEGKTFAEIFVVTRWLFGVPAAPHMRLRNLALVVPDDSGLENAAGEKQFMKGLNGAGRKIEEIAATFLGVTQAMETGNYDAWHFTGHARAFEGTDADRCYIELTKRQPLRPADIVGTVENVRRPRPFIFFNACQSAQAGRSLTGVGGWATRFLKPGVGANAASAFIGTYWSVDDGVAFEFAKALYGSLLAGVPIGEAVRDARLAIKQDKGSTWLAYTVYADPMATVVN